jgi:hypothetical protein
VPSASIVLMCFLGVLLPDTCSDTIRYVLLKPNMMLLFSLLYN